MTVRVALLTGAALLALASAPAFAQSGPYVGIGGGASWLEDADITGAGNINSLEFDTGWAGIVKGGYALGNGLRPELELGMRSFGVDRANGGATSDGEAKLYTGFANLMYDFMPAGSWSPYVGAGLGVARMTTDVRVNNTTSDDADTTWAGQAVAGVWYALDSNWLLSADYRYMYLGDTKFST
ncbi:outer membrane beta-barrel protein, partial [Ferrovibrio sp.]